MSCPVKLQHNLIVGAHCHQFQLVQSDQKRIRVQQGLNPSLPSWIPSFLMWHKAGMTWHKASYVSFLLQPIRSRIEISHNQAIKASRTTWNQFIIMPKTCTLWFMDQAHEPQIGKLREMWFGWHQRDLQQSSQGSKIGTWLAVMQSTLGSSDSSNNITKIISLMHALIPSVKANQHAMLGQNSSSHYPKQQRTS